ncbi:MAG: ribosome biogenesis GTPase Der [Marinifilaceae bacterium]
MSKIIAIVGRPNVGKSTLFNRLTGTRKAIVNEESGVTRDRNYGRANWNGVDFSVIDTGGYVTNTEDLFEEEINKQVILGMEEADMILFVVDVEIGITDLDMTFAKTLRGIDKPILMVVNKVDNSERMYDAQEFYKMGVGEDMFTISSINGSGTGELLDAVVQLLPDEDINEDELEIPRIAIVGRPNVGKSSTINALVGEDRNIVTDVAGTTRDALYTRYNRFSHDFLLIDTAGLRKKTKVNEDVEFYSTMRSIRAIEESDVCMLLIDATRGVESQDINIFDLIIKNRKGCVIVVNKWDLIEKETNTMKEIEEAIREKIAPFNDIPIVFSSAVTKQRLLKGLEETIRVYHNRKRKIRTSELNKVMLEAIEKFRPPALKGKFIRIKYVTQLPTYAPTFAFFANLPQYVKDPYKRYLENRIREHWDFTGVPIQIFMRGK